MIKVISTGSEHGNAVLVDERILIDVGVGVKKVAPYLDKLQYVLLTHKHGDHFHAPTIKSIAKKKPLVKFLVPSYLAESVRKLGVLNVYEIAPNHIHADGTDFFTTTRIKHKNSDMSDCPNVAWRLNLNGTKILYVTDTHVLDNLVAKDYDYYIIEMNFKESELLALIQKEIEEVGFSHRIRAKETHLSLERAEAFLKANISDMDKAVIIPMHMSGTYYSEIGRMYNGGEYHDFNI